MNRMKNKCGLNLKPESEKCRGTSCLTCGWNPVVKARRKEILRVYGPTALMPQAPAGSEKMDTETRGAHIRAGIEEARRRGKQIGRPPKEEKPNEKSA